MGTNFSLLRTQCLVIGKKNAVRLTGVYVLVSNYQFYVFIYSVALVKCKPSYIVPIHLYLLTEPTYILYM